MNEIITRYAASLGQGLIAGLAGTAADALSLTSWQMEMYGWMAITVFVSATS
jgi:ABC-type uncharacterized transport system permease subunit